MLPAMSPPGARVIKRLAPHLRGHEGKLLEAHSRQSKNTEKRSPGTVRHESNNFPAERILDGDISSLGKGMRISQTYGDGCLRRRVEDQR